MNQLQQQVEILQGQNEVLRHRLRELYTDLDQRVTALENGKPLKRTKSAIDFTNINKLDDQNAYQQAYNLIATRQYDQAITALNTFMQKYPKSSYIPNAIYWQAEVLAVQGKNVPAEKMFQQLIAQFPNNAKVPDAQLKLAMIAAANNQTVAAEQQLQTIINQYPNSAAASLAATKLRQLKGQ
jgi:tol-pal system protein YbgF